ncbi:MAG: right-handed parallel beta-helix repeat-containing protein [Nanoarchaeota archaeon]|nr:right-handed parallel beta-helix repeat-containing protein [Nanoarchaeota archaeon]
MVKRNLLFHEHELAYVGIVLITIFSVFLIAPEQNVRGMAGEPGSCYTPDHGADISVTSDLAICEGTYHDVQISIDSDDVNLDCGNSWFVRSDPYTSGSPFKIYDRSNIIVKNCNFHVNTYFLIRRSSNVLIENVFQSEPSKGAKVEGGCSDITFRNYEVKYAENWGLHITDVDGLTLDNVNIGNAKEAGVALYAPQTNMVLNDVSICHNGWYDMYSDQHNYNPDISGLTCDNSESSQFTCEPCPPPADPEYNDCWNPDDPSIEYDFSQPGLKVCPGTYNYPNGLAYQSKCTTPQVIDCQGASFLGDKMLGRNGLTITTHPYAGGKVTVQNCHFENYETGLQFTSRITNSYDHIDIELLNNEFVNNDVGIKQFSYQNHMQKNLFVQDNIFVGNGVAIIGDMIEDMNIVNNNFENNDIGISIWKARSFVLTNNDFLNNRIGLKMTGIDDYAPVFPKTISGNVFSSTETDIYCRDTFGGDYDNNECAGLNAENCCYTDPESGNCLENVQCVDEQVSDEETELSVVIGTCGGDITAGNLKISSSTTLCPMTLSLRTLRFASDNIVFDCNGATIKGSMTTGMDIKDRQGITIKNCKIDGFQDAIMVAASTNTKILDNEFKHNLVSIKSSGGENLEIKGNSLDQDYVREIHTSGAEVNIDQTDNTKIQNNIFKLKSYGINLMGVDGADIISNQFYAEHQNLEARGIFFFHNPNTVPRPLNTDILIQGNTWSGNYKGIFLTSSAALKNSIIRNNQGTKTRNLLWFNQYGAPEHDNLLVENNICVECLQLVHFNDAKNSIIQKNSLVNPEGTRGRFIEATGPIQLDYIPGISIFKGTNNQIKNNYLDGMMIQPGNSEHGDYGIIIGGTWGDPINGLVISNNYVKDFNNGISAPYFATYASIDSRLDSSLYTGVEIKGNKVIDSYSTGISASGTTVLIHDNLVLNTRKTGTGPIDGAGILVRAGSAKLISDVSCHNNADVYSDGTISQQSDLTCDTSDGDGTQNPTCNTVCLALSALSPEDCIDAVDNDGDGQADCLDPDCQVYSICNPGAPPVPDPEPDPEQDPDDDAPAPYCGDGGCGSDETCDSCAVDCGTCSPDPDPNGCSPVPEDCNNGIDDDCDGNIDQYDVDCILIDPHGDKPTDDSSQQPKTGPPGTGPQLQIFKLEFDKGYIEAKSYGPVVLKKIDDSNAPEGAMLSFEVISGTISDISVHYYGDESFEAYSKSNTDLNPVVLDSSGQNMYGLSGVTDGKFVLVEVGMDSDPVKPQTHDPTEIKG